MNLLGEVNGSAGQSWSIASCVHIAELWAGTAQELDEETRNSRGTASDMWDSDCWRTMAHWLVDHPYATDAEADAQWDIICARPEGDPYRIIGGIILLEV
jgi:hypothetical protein